MQLTTAVQESGPIRIPALSVAHPGLPLPQTRDLAQSKTSTAPLPDSIPATHGTFPVLPDTGRDGCEPVTDTKCHPLSPKKIVRPRSTSVSRRISKSDPFIEQDIPLYLVPHIIARAIWHQGEQMFRISVIRTKQHYYTIRLRTAKPGKRTLKKPCGKKKQGCPGKTG